MLTPKKVPSALLVKMTLWTFVEAQITNIEIKHDALLKILVDMHSQFGPIWQIFLPVYHQPSKRAPCFISILRNLASTTVHKAILTSEMFVTFLISTQPGNISGWYCVFWRLGDIKNKKYLRIKKMHPFLVIFVDWNWKIKVGHLYCRICVGIEVSNLRRILLST